jgi:DNA-3-methyladenine glycosylase
MCTTGEVLPRSFHARGAETVARALLGAVLTHEVGDGRVLRARVVETEAYVGTHDLACHSARGRTPRTAVMFGPAGIAYVYLVYGMHDMFNVVTGAEGEGQAVLVRAAAPLDGWSARLDGPARLARAMGITRALHGTDLCVPPLYFTAGPPPSRVVATPRIGVDYAGAWTAAPLRFLDPDSPHVSRPPGLR